ncbi:polygalacturonase, putative [Plasmopara halstedii]|uniref:endo-polygalacturonase n=1 Tax=Plasmopara halstedii TaxID=4781 RepID=A0A0P1B725_PLAHL|nr:polygalacturonase, putative [Plasmopara halstedii]CEG49916.1 polygalacturonase, putative [Plasmopara halstedii]|eukprot:XP_024586285.1 polygalacturonase, putative [Plasmopara halstedii]
MKSFSAIFIAFALFHEFVESSSLPLKVNNTYNSSQPLGTKCTLTGTYRKGTDISLCSKITVSSLTVPAGVTLDLSKAKRGTIIEFVGTTTFGTKMWDGPLVRVTGIDLQVKGSGILDGQGARYWKKGQSITRPVFFKLLGVMTSTISGLTLKNMPYRTFSIVNCKKTTLTGLTLDSSAGNGIATNTDGFDLTKNDQITITGNIIRNQDDCLAMQSSTNTVFTNNCCYNGHGISIGSIGGQAVDESTTVQGLLVQGNTIQDSENGLRIKAIIGLQGLVSNVKYINNKVVNVRNAIVIHSDYSKARGRYTGAPTSKVTISGVTISGLSGSASKLYDIGANPDCVSGLDFSGLSLSYSLRGTISGLAANIKI